MTNRTTSVSVLIDYQNIHLTADGKYGTAGDGRHLTLIHPLHFAFQVMATRKARQTDHMPSELLRVVAFRGLPSNKHEANAYRRSLAQKSEWTRDRRVEVVYRPLRYPQDWPEKSAQEKGVDVLLALELVRSAERRTADVIILASHDTDLEPAIEMAEQAKHARVETAGWEGCKRLRGGSPARWHTFLGAQEFESARDRKIYT